MEIFMTNIVYGTSVHKLKLELATILHAPPFYTPTGPPLNFEVYLFPKKKRSQWQSGALTLPSAEVGSQFLQLYGAPHPQRFLTLGTIRVQFQLSQREARRDVLERIRRQPFEDPRISQAREREAEELQALGAQVCTIQFGWECRDMVYSVEWEKTCAAVLTFDADRRVFRVAARGLGLEDTRIIAIRASQIGWVSAAVHPPSGVPTIFFSLSNPPAFETTPALSDFNTNLAEIFGHAPPPPLRHKWSAFDESHEPVAPYTSLALRLECKSLGDLDTFRKLARAAHVRPDNFAYHVERRGLFAQNLRDEYATWAVRQPWTVAFQVEALLRSWLLDFQDVLRLRQPIEKLLREKGREYTAALLQDFVAHAKALFWYGEDNTRGEDGTLPAELSVEDPVALFSRVQTKFVHKPMATAFDTADPTALFHCLRITVTPTTLLLEGPFPERSNRVMRTYFRSQDCFLRVSFQDEDRLQLRFDREVDGRGFVRRRVMRILLDGLTIAGAHFDFLAYSQSALKEHAVWFVKPFKHVGDDGYTSFVDAATIIDSLGTFRNLSFDPKLIYCPARYAARISQAFTATDASITVDVGQIITGHDIKTASGNYVFTDGVGTISPQLAKEIWRALQERRGRGRRDRTYPRAYQVRFQGSKGMLSVDHTLSGRSILLRPSMIKFESPSSLTIEIARAFDKPGAYYLNRPLIMLLEGLGVPYAVFQTLQDDAVREVKESVDSLERSARLLEAHGLGASFRLTSSMLGLHKLGVGPLHGDLFWEQLMDFSINHVLRELKHHARIPVPDSWTLVGVADVHGYLEEGEIFACVDSPNHTGLIYLEGRTLISRSPTIHPGDVQVVHAIGRPPPGSPFVQESLRNTVVFSIKGERPLPSCLGGGDLDGDVYNVTTRADLLPPRTYHPASYEPAPKKLVDHESTMADVAEFVAEYIISDTLGIIATTWLIIADQSTQGIMHPDCIKLAALHSDAVDYPKSGNPVPIAHIPRLHLPTRPDWNAPETFTGDSDSYYESVRAIGKLYRSIDLPALRQVNRVARNQRRHMRDEADDTVTAILAKFRSDQLSEDDEVYVALRDRTAEFIDPGDYDDGTVTGIWELYNTYVSRLRAICADHTLSTSRSAMLTEEEAIVGTIVAKCSQRRKRKDLMSQMREQTAMLVNDVRNELESEDDMPLEDSLRRAWIAFRVATLEERYFGARSFGWVAIGAIFDTIKEIEDEERTIARR
ncbi:RdRP-domain-containing protein [Pilatotrama ljubarskyi]|nr:RdRP-domain-containing protein [Pilatotrama ljubarskyi]